MHRLFLLLLLAIVYSTIQTKAQEIKPKGYFIEDSIKIGKPIPFSLSVSYPEELQVLLPDSLYDFSPYELDKKVYFPSRLNDSLILDSVIYYLVSFEIDPVQKLKLPVYIPQSSDSIEIFSEEDSVLLVELITMVSDTLSLKENTAYQDVNLFFNYPYLVLGIGVLIIVFLIIFLVFGKSIKRRYLMSKMKKRHLKFLELFNNAIRKIRDSGDDELIESSLVDWKSYMEILDKKPYQKWTTKELALNVDDKKLLEAMKDIDAKVYGGIKKEQIHQSFEDLEYYTNQLYQKKTAEISNG
ncbi:MAG: hypothetical protein AAF363_10545 [Bacteroidota bacterium]